MLPACLTPATAVLAKRTLNLRKPPHSCCGAGRALPPPLLFKHAQGFTLTNLLACAGRASTLNQLLTMMSWLVASTGVPEALVECASPLPLLPHKHTPVHCAGRSRRSPTCACSR